MKLRVFIASSAEGLEIAETLQGNLENDAEVTVWSQDIFRPSEFILESLEKSLGAADFGVFVFSPDDLVTIRGNEQTVARDNVIFECGLFVGRLGRGRTAFIQPGQNTIRLPSDLSGVTGLTYDPHRQDRNLTAALGPPSNKLRKIFRGLVPVRKARELELPLSERKRWLSKRQTDILDCIENAEQLSRMELHKRFAEYSEGELHYRLEYLRLLSFITVSPGHDPDKLWEVIYSLSSEYKSAQQLISGRIGSQAVGRS